jgi:hypothetical protein
MVLLAQCYSKKKYFDEALKIINEVIVVSKKKKMGK